MPLLDFPPELFMQVVHDLVETAGVDGAWQFRSVCRTFALYIDDEIFSNQPLSAFRLPSRPYLYYSRDGDYTKILTENLGRFILARLKKRLDVKPTIPNTIIRSINELGRFEPGGQASSARMMEIAICLCNAIAGEYSPPWNTRVLEGLQHGSGLVYTPGRPRKLADLLSAAVVMSNLRAIEAYMDNGAVCWQKGTVFAYPLKISTTQTRNKEATSLMLVLMRIPADGTNELFQLWEMLESVFGNMVSVKETSQARFLISWIATDMPLPSKSKFNRLLNTAIDSKDPAIIETTLKIKVKSSPKVLWEHYIRACNTRDIPTVMALVEYGKFKINRMYWNTSPLNDAIRQGSVDIARALLEAGANPDGPTEGIHNKQGETKEFLQPLRTAVRRGSYELVDLLLKYGASLGCLEWEDANDADEPAPSPLDFTASLLRSANGKADKRFYNRLMEARAQEIARVFREPTAEAYQSKTTNQPAASSGALSPDGASEGPAFPVASPLSVSSHLSSSQTFPGHSPDEVTAISLAKTLPYLDAHLGDLNLVGALEKASNPGPA